MATSFKLSCLLIAGFVSQSLMAQKEVKKFYDPQRRQLQENYFVSAADSETIEGKYKRYFQNGNVEMEGQYEEGKRSGTFLEYHENGKVSRKRKLKPHGQWIYFCAIRSSDQTIY